MQELQTHVHFPAKILALEDLPAPDIQNMRNIGLHLSHFYIFFSFLYLFGSYFFHPSTFHNAFQVEGHGEPSASGEEPGRAGNPWHGENSQATGNFETPIQQP